MRNQDTEKKRCQLLPHVCKFWCPALTTNKTLTSSSRVSREGSVKNNQVPLTAAQHEQVQGPPGTSLELSARQRARGPNKTQKYPLDVGAQSLRVSSRSYQPVVIKTRSLGGQVQPRPGARENADSRASCRTRDTARPRVRAVTPGSLQSDKPWSPERSKRRPRELQGEWGFA